MGPISKNKIKSYQITESRNNYLKEVFMFATYKLYEKIREYAQLLFGGQVHWKLKK